MLINLLKCFGYGCSLQDLNNFTQSSLSPNHSLKEFPVEESWSSIYDLEEVAEQNKRIPGRNEVLEGITEIKKALLNLDSSAESVVQLFSKLGAMATSERVVN